MGCLKDPWKSFRDEATIMLAKAFNENQEGIPEPAEPPVRDFGDLSSPACFSLAGRFRKSPVQIASETVESHLSGGAAVKEYALIESVSAEKGYINFRISWKPYASLLVEKILTEGDSFGSSGPVTLKRVIIESPSVNPNKPWHIGHARNAVLGDSLSRTMTMAGFLITRMDYIDDLGIQVAKTIWGIDNLKNAELPATTTATSHKKFDHSIGELYVRAEQAISESEEAQEEMRKIMQAMEDSSSELSKRARDLSERVLEAQSMTAKRLQVFHDIRVWESNIVHSGMLAKAMQMITTRTGGAVRKEVEGDKAGCLVLDVSGFEEFKNLKDTEKVLARSDGTATYTGKDIAFQLWKFGLLDSEGGEGDSMNYGELEKQDDGTILYTTISSGKLQKPFAAADIVINVVGAEQAHPQRIVFLSLKALGFEKQFENSHHMAYEHVQLPEGRFSGRKGTWLGYTLDEVLDEACQRALALVKEKSPALSAEEQNAIADAVGIGSVRYHLLKFDADKKITFSWDDALSFDGNAAPYLQYSHARACRILEKAGGWDGKFDVNVLEKLVEEDKLTRWEKDLLLHISKFPSLVSGIAEHPKKQAWGTKFSVNSICDYAYELATSFSQFYTNCRVIGSEEEKERLIMVKCFQQTMKNALHILGIKAIERM